MTLKTGVGKAWGNEKRTTLIKSGLESFRLQVKLGVSSLTIKHAWLAASTDSLWLSSACYSNWIYTQKLQYVYLPVAFASIWTGWKPWSLALVLLWCFSLNTFLFWKRTKNNVSVLAVMRATMAREILLWVFHSNFRAFSCIFQTPYWADHLWSGHQGRDRFILHKIPILVKGDDIRSGKQAKARHSRLRVARESMGKEWGIF